jgi:hypothetical protein
MEQGRDIESQIKPLSEQLEQVTREREANRTKQRRVIMHLPCLPCPLMSLLTPSLYCNHRAKKR